jgi:hypothetical protein
MRNLFVFLLLSVTCLAYAQVPKPVKWTFSLDAKNDGKAEFKATASIEKGWNIYSVYMGNDGPVPTSFDFTTIEGGSLDGKIIEVSKAMKAMDPLFDMEVIKFKEEAIFTNAVKGGKGLKLSGSVMYMCCDSARCLPPTTQAFNLSL